MTKDKCRIWIVCLLAAVAALGETAKGQVHHLVARPLASNVVVPQSMAFDVGRRGAVQITEVNVNVAILEQAATTTMDIGLNNPTHARLEAELIVPVPDGAVVRGFTFHGSGSEPTAELLPKEESRRLYDSLVAKIRDPALLEFVGFNLVRSSVFPVEPQGTQKVRLTYEHILAADGDRIDYVLPRSESVEYSVPWRVSVSVKSKRPISTVYSPSHRLETVRAGENHVKAWVADDATTQPGPFRLSFVLEREGLSATLFAYPEPRIGGGYFLLLAGLPARPPLKGDGPTIKREVTMVFDRSGSMSGEKIEQVREAALQVLGGLEEGEAFNIIVYSEVVDFFAREPVIKDEANIEAATDYLKGIKARGGTNIYEALLEALRQKPLDGMLPIVLFLTDGLPTIGQTSEVAIRDLAVKANQYEKRIFTFGVGVDVNTPLLEKIASESRATATFVLPREDVEVKVAQVFKRLAGPVLAGPELEIVDRGGNPAAERVRDLVPSKLPDLFEGDQLILLGQYVGEVPLTFKVSGNYLGRKRTFTFTFDLEKATAKNSFVPRLWASRKIAVMIDAIRQLGADASPATIRGRGPTDPRIKELVDEIVRLSTEFGILTEYTAFLAREGTDLTDVHRVAEEAERNFVDRAMKTRVGLGAVNQSLNNMQLSTQAQLNVKNVYLDENLQRVAITTVQQVSDRAFYRREGRWVDSRLVTKEDQIQPDRVIEFGSAEFRELAGRLARDGRQGSLALRGDILMLVGDELILVTAGGGK